MIPAAAHFSRAPKLHCTRCGNDFRLRRVLWVIVNGGLDGDVAVCVGCFIAWSRENVVP